MTISEAYQILGLEYTADNQTLRKKYFDLRKEYYLAKNCDEINNVDMAARIVHSCIMKKQQSIKPTATSQESQEYEFYEHMYETPKATIPFEQILRNEIILNNAKYQIRDYLMSLISNLDYVYDLDKLKQFIDNNGLNAIININEESTEKDINRLT